MYGVVTRYVLKPKRALARSSSAPSIHQSTHQTLQQPFNQSIISGHSYGTGDDLVAVPQPINQSADQLHRSRSEVPASRMTVYSYQTQPSPTPSMDETLNHLIDQSDENMPLMGFVSPVKSDDKLPIILTLASSLGSLLFGFHIAYSSPFEQSIYQSINQSNNQPINPAVGPVSNQNSLIDLAHRSSRHSLFIQPTNQSTAQPVYQPPSSSLNPSITMSELDFMFSLISIGAIIGALTSGPVAAKFGRRLAIIVSTIPYLVGTMIMMASPSINQSINESAYMSLCIGRLLVGVGVGASSVLVPLYIAEISPPSLRGSLGATNSFFMSFGVLLVNALGFGAVHQSTNQSINQSNFWQFALFLSLFPLLIMALVMYFYGVETPRYLMSVDREDEAKNALRRLRGEKWDVDGELRDLAGWDEFGLGSVTQSKSMLRRWKQEFSALFESNNPSIDQSMDDALDDPYGDADDLPTSNSIDNFKTDKYDLRMPSPPPTIAPQVNQSTNQVTTPRSAGSAGVLKSALSSKSISRSSSANLSDQVTNHPTNQSNNVVLPEPKKTVRVKLPGREEAEATTSPSPPQKLARARSIARRAFPIHAVTTSANPWWTHDDDDESTNQSNNQSIYWHRANLIPLLIGVSLQFIQQASGINAFMFHMKDILQGESPNAATDESSTVHALYGAIAVNGLQLLMGGVALILMDRAGRRTWLLASCAGLTIGAFCLSYCYAVSSSNSFKIVAMMIYIAAFAVGMGPMPWLICSEIFPSAIRSVAISLATTVNWASAFVITASFPLIDHLIGTAGVYALYGTIIAASAVYIAFVLPETQGKSLDEIEEMFARPAHGNSSDSHV